MRRFASWVSGSVPASWVSSAEARSRQNIRPASSESSSAAWHAEGFRRRRAVVHIAMITPTGADSGPGSGTVDTARTHVAVGARARTRSGSETNVRGAGVELAGAERIDEQGRRVGERGVAEEGTVQQAS